MIEKFEKKCLVTYASIDAINENKIVVKDVNSMYMEHVVVGCFVYIVQDIKTGDYYFPILKSHEKDRIINKPVFKFVTGDDDVFSEIKTTTVETLIDELKKRKDETVEVLKCNPCFVDIKQMLCLPYEVVVKLEGATRKFTYIYLGAVFRMDIENSTGENVGEGEFEWCKLIPGHAFWKAECYFLGEGAMEFTHLIGSRFIDDLVRLNIADRDVQDRSNEKIWCLTKR